MKKVIIFSVMLLGCLGLFGQSSVDIEQPAWEQVLTPAKGPDLSTFTEANGRMWITDSGLEYSDDDGLTWQRHPMSSLLGIIDVFAGDFGVMFTRRKGIFPYFTSNGEYQFYISTDGGTTFTQSTNTLFYNGSSHHGGASSYPVGMFKKSPTELVQIQFSTSYGFIAYFLRNSLDGGLTWDSSYTLSPSGNTSPAEFSIQRDTISSFYQNADSSRTLRVFTQDYENPTTHSFDLPEEITTTDFHFQNGQITIIDDTGRIFVSVDLGQTWDIYDNPTIATVLMEGQVTFGLDEILVTTDNQIYSVDYQNPTLATLVFTSPPNENITIAFTESGTLASSTTGGIFIRPTNEAEFTFHSPGLAGTATDFKIAGNVLWAKLDNSWYRSEDDGINWSFSPLSILDDSEIILDHNGIFILEKNKEIFQSVDNGLTWQLILTFQSNVATVQSENEVFIYDGSQIYFSSDGLTFDEVTHPAGYGMFVYHQNQLYYFADNLRYISPDNGVNWDVPEPANGENGGIISSNLGQLMSIESTGTISSIRISNDNGLTWIYSNFIYPIFSTYTNLLKPYLGIHNKMIVFGPGTISANNGENWAEFESPFVYTVSSGFFPGNYVYGPRKLASTENTFYGIADNKVIYRTSLPFLKTQLPDSTTVKNQLTGHLYKDRNDNCELDSLDSPIPNKVIKVGDHYRRTNENGWYGLFYDFTNKEVPYHTDSIRYTEHHCENNHEGIFQINQNQNADTLDIAFYPIPGITDAGINAWAIGVFRPGGTPQIKIKVTNHGSVDLVDEQIIFTYNPSKQTIDSNSVGTALTNNQWQIPVSLAPEASKIFTIHLNIATSATNTDILNYSMNLPLIDDANPADNHTTLTQNVVTSIDPNDKTAYENTTLPYTQNDFTYRVRFQNTGNDTAFKVVILDTLPPELDVFTLEMLEASHPYELKIQYPVLRWTFRDILLPDSTTNEPESHGYLFFKIKTKDNLVITDTIKNSAAIYFDYNDPVITDDAVTAIEKGFQETNLFLSICEGEEINGTPVFMDTTITNLDTTDSIYNFITNSIIEVEPTYYLDSLITLHPGDTILGIPIFNDTTLVYQGLTTEGCDSIINYQITLLTTNTADLDKFLFSATVLPNPTVGEAVLVLDAIESERIDIDLYHLTGQQIKSIVNDQIIPAGRQEFPLDLNELPVGVYWLRIRTERGERALRVVRME